MDSSTRARLLALLNMNPRRGATPGEWANARRAIIRIAERFGVLTAEVGPWLRRNGFRVGADVAQDGPGVRSETRRAWRCNECGREFGTSAEATAHAFGAHVKRPAEWVRPKTAPGYEYRRCGKASCRCMHGGAWHGPYRYGKRRKKKHVYSEYWGRA